MTFQTSEDGVELIKHFEGLRLTRYNDAAGKPTIGYGHLIQSGELFPTRIMEDVAEELLRNDLRIAEEAVLRRTERELTQGEFDALVSFTFNLGAHNLAHSTLLRKVNADDYTAAGEFGRWIFAGGKPLSGLIKRRAAEAMRFIA